MYFKAFILGVIQGITEFLPISSTGHLILVGHYLQLSPSKAFNDMFDIVIQAGSIVAVLLFFRKQLLPGRGALQPLSPANPFYRKWLLIGLAFLPAAAAGVLFSKKIKLLLFNPPAVAAAMVAGGLLLLLAEKHLRPGALTDDAAITPRRALLVGLTQCLALWPGMSRSASTIIGGLFAGFARPLAAEFSFFVAIPTLLGAAVKSCWDVGGEKFAAFSAQTYAANPDISPAALVQAFAGHYALGRVDYLLTLLLGLAVTFVVSYAVIAFFMDFIRKRSLAPFAYYRIAVGLGIGAYLYAGAA